MLERERTDEAQTIVRRGEVCVATHIRTLLCHTMCAIVFSSNVERTKQFEVRVFLGRRGVPLTRKTNDGHYDHGQCRDGGREESGR